MCDEYDEDANHLFVSCGIPQQIWEFVTSWCRMSHIYILELKDFLKVQNRCRGSGKWRKMVSSIIQTTLWVIWKNRNDVVFNNKQPNLAKIKEEIRTYVGRLV
ncbi:hypothetical protein HanIR_Chr14g0726101 [Helianthus annuus]|nr:hypothetical protein HanIR_Chr14g0726101 [Helianthus annuus]